VDRVQDANFVSFLEMCLQWEPEKRPSPWSALQHPWLQQQNKDGSKKH